MLVHLRSHVYVCRNCRRTINHFNHNYYQYQYIKIYLNITVVCIYTLIKRKQTIPLPYNSHNQSVDYSATLGGSAGGDKKSSTVYWKREILDTKV